MTTWRIALREIAANPFRALLMWAGVALAGCAMTGTVLLIAGVNESVRRTAGRLGADLMIVPSGERIAKQFNEALITGRPATFYLEPAATQAASDTPGIAAISPETFVETLTNARCCSGKFFVVGFDPATDFTVTPWLKGAARLPVRDASDWMIVGDRILLREGASATFFGTTFTVAGVLEPTGTGMDWTIYVPQRALSRMVAASGQKAETPLSIPDGAASALFVSAEPGTDLIDLTERIEQSHPRLQAVLSSTVGAIARRQMSGVTATLAAIVIALWIMSLVLSGAVFTQAVRERQAELGLLMAKGARRRFVLGMLACESGLISLTAGLTGCASGALVIVSFRQLLRQSLATADVLPSAWNAAAIVVLLAALMTASALLAALTPALKMLLREPYAAIRAGAAT